MLTITTPPNFVPESVAFMVKHGCVIKSFGNHCEVTFPEGTMQEETFPRMPSSTRFTLLLPDGCMMRQVYLRYEEQNVLFYPHQCIHEQTTA